jgi:hypothetical protein
MVKAIQLDHPPLPKEEKNKKRGNQIILTILYLSLENTVAVLQYTSFLNVDEDHEI